jgi:hypothetical protein
VNYLLTHNALLFKREFKPFKNIIFLTFEFTHFALLLLLTALPEEALLTSDCTRTPKSTTSTPTTERKTKMAAAAGKAMSLEIDRRVFDISIS